MQPSFQLVEEGEKLLLVCQSTLPVKWSFNDHKPLRSAILGPQTLTIKKVEVIHKGHYECAGTSESGEQFLSHTLLKVLGKPFCTTCQTLHLCMILYMLLHTLDITIVKSINFTLYSIGANNS